MIKKYLFLSIVVLGCFAETSFAQLQVLKPPPKKESLLQIPMVHIVSVESLFVPVHIDAIKPLVVSLDTKVLASQRQAACEHFKNFKPTLILTAQRSNNLTAKLQWETQYAFYAKSFGIERSLSDTFHFVPVNFAEVSYGTSFKKKYHLPDGNDYSGISYYRIQQNNGDSGFAYSNIVAINGFDPIVYSIYPSPATSKVWIDVSSKQSGNLTIFVYDPAGKVVIKQSFSCLQNTHTVQNMNVSKLAAGLYQVKIIMPDESSVNGKFMKD